MKSYGIIKRRLKDNRFATPVFTDDNKLFIQQSNNGLNCKFVEVDIKEEDVKKIDIIKEFDDSLSEPILCFYEKDNIQIGKKDELFIFLLKKLDEIQDVIVKVRISEVLNLNGKTLRYKKERDDFFLKKKIDIQFPNKDNFLTVPKKGFCFDRLMNRTIEKYAEKINDITIDLKWDDVLLTSIDNKDDFIIDKFRFELSDVFDNLIKNQKNIDLSYYLINKYNSEIDFYIENTKEISREKTVQNLDSIKEFIKLKNNE